MELEQVATFFFLVLLSAFTPTASEPDSLIQLPRIGLASLPSPHSSLLGILTFLLSLLVALYQFRSELRWRTGLAPLVPFGSAGNSWWLGSFSPYSPIVFLVRTPPSLFLILVRFYCSQGIKSLEKRVRHPIHL